VSYWHHDAQPCGGRVGSGVGSFVGAAVGVAVGFDVGFDVGVLVGVLVGDGVIAEFHVIVNVPDPEEYASTMKYTRCVEPTVLIHECSRVSGSSVHCTEVVPGHAPPHFVSWRLS